MKTILRDVAAVLARHPLALLSGMAGLWSLAILLTWIAAPIIDMYGFRQTQTAISAWYMLRDGLALRYETPVLGAPWSIPFEFPTYQWLTALVAMTGIPLDVAGRLVSYAFFIACLWPLRLLLRGLGLGPRAFLIIATLLLSSPLYVFWSRTVMIESAALFFALLWLALLLRVEKPLAVGPRDAATWTLAGVTLAAGTLAVLTKATTFPAFCVAGCLLVLGRVLHGVRAPRDVVALDRRTTALRLGTALAACLIPIALGYVWVFYSDAVKAENVFGALLTSDALSTWNFGTLAQRLGTDLWVRVVALRALPETLGHMAWAAPLALGAGLVFRRTAWPVAVFALAFLVPFLVFTNLHMVHNYYQYANGLFLVLAVGLVLAAIAEHRSTPVAALLVGLVVAGNLTAFSTQFLHVLRHDWRGTDLMRVAGEIRARVPEDHGIVVLGLDWSSELPYYAERRAIGITNWFPPEKVAAVLDDPGAALGDTAFGGVAVCGDPKNYPVALRPLIEDFVAGRAELARTGACRLLSPEQDPNADPPPPGLTELLARAQVEAETVPHDRLPEGGVLAHPPSRLVAETTGGQTLKGTFGYVDSVWKDGRPPPVTFSIRLRDPGTAGTGVLMERTLRPQDGEAVRGPQPFSVEIPGSGTVELVFETTAAGGDNSWGWTYWGNPR